MGQSQDNSLDIKLLSKKAIIPRHSLTFLSIIQHFTSISKFQTFANPKNFKNAMQMQNIEMPKPT